MNTEIEAASMSLDEWMAEPRQFEYGSPRPITLTEFRSWKGYHNPLDDHGFFRMPNGISKADKRRFEQAVIRWRDSAQRGADAYRAAEANNELPIVQEIVDYRADGLDLERTMARTRLFWKKANRRIHG